MVALQWCVSFSVQFSGSVVSDTLWPHGLQHARLPCPSPTLGACSNSCPMSWWCRCPLLLPSIFSGFRVFSSESVPYILWTKYWSFRFSISLSEEHSGLISVRSDLFYLLAAQGTLKSLLQHHGSKAWVIYFIHSMLSVNSNLLSPTFFRPQSPRTCSLYLCLWLLL